MSTDEQMTMALLALGAIALFAMNNKTESKSPVRRAEDVQNSKRVEIQKWIKNARALISKIDARTHAYGGENNGIPNRTDLDELNSMRLRALGLDKEAKDVGISADSAGRTDLNRVRQAIASVYNRDKKSQQINVQLNQTVVDASQQHNMSVKNKLLQKHVAGDRILNIQMQNANRQASENAAMIRENQGMDVDIEQPHAQNTGLGETIDSKRQQEKHTTTEEDLNKPKLFPVLKDKPRAEDATNKMIVFQGKNNPRGIAGNTANIALVNLSGLAVDALVTGGAFPTTRRQAGGFGPSRMDPASAAVVRKEQLEISRVRHQEEQMKRQSKMTRQRTIEAPPVLEAISVTTAFDQSATRPAKVQLSVITDRPEPPPLPPEPLQITHGMVRVVPPKPLLQTTNDPQSRSDGRANVDLPTLPAIEEVVDLTGDMEGFDLIAQWAANEKQLQNQPQTEQDEYLKEKYAELQQMRAAAIKQVRRYEELNNPPGQTGVEIEGERKRALQFIDNLLEPPFLKDYRQNFRKAKNLLSPEWSAKKGLAADLSLTPRRIFFWWWSWSDEILALRERIPGIRRKEHPKEKAYDYRTEMAKKEPAIEPVSKRTRRGGARD